MEEPRVLGESGDQAPSGRLLLTPEESAYAINVSRSQLWKMLASGEITSIKIGRCRRVPVDALRQWIADQVDAA